MAESSPTKNDLSNGIVVNLRGINNQTTTSGHTSATDTPSSIGTPFSPYKSSIKLRGQGGSGANTDSPYKSAAAATAGSSKSDNTTTNNNNNNNNSNNSRSKPQDSKKDSSDSRVILSDGTEVFEVEKSVNTSSQSQYSRNKPYRSTRSKKNAFANVEHYVIEEEIRNEHALMEFTGCVLDAPDGLLNKIIENEYNKINLPIIYYNNLYKTNLLNNGIINNNTNKYDINSNTQIRNCDLFLNETPYDKYGRIKRELVTFIDDLNKFENECGSNAGGGAASDKSIEMIIESLKKLENKLDILRNNNEYKMLFDFKYNLYNYIDNALMNVANNIVSGNGKGNNDNEMKNDNNRESDEKGTYSLFSKYKSKKLVGTPDREFLHFEERIADLEKRIGFVTELKNPFPDVMLGVTFLEQRFAFVFQDRWVTVKALASKMKGDLSNIQYHLDLLLKHKHNPTQDRQKKQEMDQMRQSWQKFDELYQFMMKWDPIVFDLINIVKRMKSLQNYHYRECLFVERVNKIQNQQNIILQSLKEDSKLLNTALTSIEDNTKQLKSNLTYLQQRIGVMERKLNVQ